MTDPASGQSVALAAGSEVPSWAEELIDPSRFEGEAGAEVATAPSPAEETEPDAGSEAGLDTAERPNRSAPKGDWVDYAVAQGMDRAEAEDLTKEELLDRYSG